MKTLQDLIKDLTDIIVEEQKINDYLENEPLDLEDTDLSCAKLKDADLSCADLRWPNLTDIKITKEQLDKLTVIEEKKMNITESIKFDKLQEENEALKE
ncbi:hypothetical protein C6B38_07745 [Spiroplasma sp. ChiS]|uniref:pentapeptide repeat-containing protein n=1 Tax=Spiroplasma sp. ChiS TaxID=2099885 RepID=UPI000CF946D3|nr:pentapeptide repeat-containing protein [Spiroplasma sp. ChiS]PQP78213.1 hypothetical protein C6B38_07745 [Spiroplasma sp. ChiS]